MSDASTPTGAPSTPQQTSQSTSTAPVADANAAAATIADPNATPAQKVQAVKHLKSLKIKVDGQEFDEKLPFEIDPNNKEAVEYMKRNLQLSKAAQKRMGEKAQIETEVRQFFELLRKDPRKILSDPSFGVDLRKIAAELVEEEIANSAKSPEQLEREKLQRDLDDLKEQRKREKEEYDKREFERVQASEYERYENSMIKALESSDLPKSPYVVKKVAEYMKMGVKEGLDIMPEDVLPLVREEILDDIRQMAQAMPLETIEKLFGGDILTKIRKKNVAKAKSGPATTAKLPDVGATKATPKDDKPKQKLTIKQMFGV